MQEKVKNDISFRIDDNIKVIKNPYTKLELLNNSNLLKEYELDYKKQIEILIIELEKQYNDIVPFVKNLEKYIKDITEQTFFSAVYLLSSSILSIFSSINILAKNWEYNSIMTLLRKLDEATTLCNLFSFECNENDSNNLNKWFSWKIIDHKIWREKTDTLPEWINIDFKSLQSYLYQMTSQSAHNWYSSLLENISTFTENYDNWLTWYYHTISALKMTLWWITEFIITLKWIYLFVIKDVENYDKLDLILEKYNPNFWKNNDFSNIEKDFPKKKN